AEALPDPQQRLRRGITVVGTEPALSLRRLVAERVRQDAGPVQALPPEEVVGEAVGLRPVELGREEAVDAGAPEELGERRREPEAVRQPAHPVALAELPLEPALAPEQLADDRL